jgi:hypothetical protein
MARRIFISYARADASAVSTLATELKSAGHDVWVDQKLEGGQDWWAEIVTAVRRCDLFLVALSPAAIQSTACGLERRWAADLLRPILPVLVDVHLRAEHQEPELSRLQWIPYRAGDPAATAGLLNAVAAMPAAPAFPSRLPDPPPAPSSSTVRELPIGRDGLPVPVTVHEQVRTARRIRLRLEWGAEWGIFEARRGWNLDTQALWHGDRLELTPVRVPGVVDDRYIFEVPLTHDYDIEGNLRCRGWKIFSLYLTKWPRTFYEFDII